MNKLLRAGYAALFRNKIFYVALGCVVLYALVIGCTHLRDYIGYSVHYDIYDGYSTGMLVLYFIIPALTAWIVGTEHSDGTLRNKIIAGHSRIRIYFSQLLVMLSAGVMLFAAFTVVCLAFDLPLSGGLQNYFYGSSYWLFVLSLALTAAMSALCTMISMACQNKMAVGIVSLLLALLMLVCGIFAFSKLTTPEYIDMVEIDESGEITDEYEIPNPSYPRGVWRKIYQSVLDVLPGGQLLMVANGDTSRAWIQTLYDGVIMLVTTAAGVLVFRREDLK